MSNANSLDIRLDPDRNCFLANVDGHDCLLEFSRDSAVIVMTSVRVPEAVGGRGIAGELTRHALDWTRSHGLKVDPACPYVRTWIQRHSDYQDLLISAG